MWKPGQIVTVCGKVCRVKRGKIVPFLDVSIMLTCKFCAFRKYYSEQYPCSRCCYAVEICKLPQECYLEEIK